MFCPECKVEYLSGFTHCSDCDADLVESLLVNNLTARALRSVQEGDDQNICTSVLSATYGDAKKTLEEGCIESSD